MPRRNTWIRTEDVEIWDNIPDRPDWLHRKLQEWKAAHDDASAGGVPPVDMSGPPLPDEQLPQIIAGIEDAEE